MNVTIRQCTRDPHRDAFHEYGTPTQDLDTSPGRCQAHFRTALRPPAPSIAAAIVESLESQREPTHLPPETQELERIANKKAEEPVSVPPTAEVHEVQTNPQLPAPVVAEPVLTEKVVRVARYVAIGLGMVGAGIVSFASLPAWVGVAVFTVAAVAGLISGMGLPSFFPTRPVVGAALAGKLIVAAGLISEYVLPHVPTEPPIYRAIVGLVVVLLFALAGKSAPQLIAAAK